MSQGRVRTAKVNELYRQVGRAVVALSGIEEMMAMVFAIVNLTMSSEESGEFFYSFQTFDQKSKIVGYAIRMNDMSDEADRWAKLGNRLARVKGLRNLIAHQGVQFRQAVDETNSGTVHLRRPLLKRTGRGRELSIDEVKFAADELDSISADMWSFIGELGPTQAVET